MLQSQLFTKVLRDAPKDEQAINAQLLIRAGFIHKEMTGVYSYLPLGLKVLENIKKIVRQEMDAIGGQELIMTSLQSKELWEKTDRWDDKKVDIWFKSKLKNGAEVGLGWSHEEQITEMMKEYLSSYRDLPVYVYQFQTKLRNELRAKSGILRGREFLMKDMYSYSTTKEAHEEFYQKVIQAYHKIFERVGLGDKTFLTFASGGAFTQFSHEFQTLTETGEDTIYLDRKKKIAVNKEVLTAEVLDQLKLKKADLEEVKASETGNIFNFGSVKSEQMGLYYKDQAGANQPVILGSYGIGISRLMGTLVEIFHDEKGILWPESVAPFDLHLINIAKDSKSSEKLYETLQKEGFSVLYDQRDATPGAKFADSDLIGLPIRILVSDKTLNEDAVEIKYRNSEKTTLIKIKDLPKNLKTR
ncbi:MAG TPA: aminoacyl--tRNA ligase-related protein [Methylomirabilota bacterium]|nr:aminoacyl--tRNA ligase-related protein [Methylomirabilota bacterium]